MIKEISYLSACYTPGADLWVVPLSQNSSWFRKLNWYCSSQLTLWFFKKHPSFSPQMKDIIQKEALPFNDSQKMSATDILVDTTNIFPNRAVLAIDVSKGLNFWLKDLRSKSDQLNTSKIRIFWGQSQIQELIKGLKEIQNDLEDLSLEIITCEPDRL